MHGQIPNYRPLPLRPVFVSLGMLMAAALVVLTELAIRFLPTEQDLSAIATGEPQVPAVSSASRAPQMAKRTGSPTSFSSDPIACAGTVPGRPTTTLEYTVFGPQTVYYDLHLPNGTVSRLTILPWTYFQPTSTSTFRPTPPSERPPEVDQDPAAMIYSPLSRKKTTTTGFQSQPSFGKRNETTKVQPGNATCTITKVVSSPNSPPPQPPQDHWGLQQATIVYTHGAAAASAPEPAAAPLTPIAALPAQQTSGQPTSMWGGNPKTAGDAVGDAAATAARNVDITGDITAAPRVVFVSDSPAPMARPGEALATRTVLRNSLGVSTGVGFVVRVTTWLLKNPLGVVTGKSVDFPSTIIVQTSVIETSAQVLTDSRGRSTAVVADRSTTTTTETPGQPTTQVVIKGVIAEPFFMSDLQYFIGFFLPTLLASLLALLVRTISVNAAMYEPFHLLTRERCTARETLFFRPSPPFAVYESLREKAISLPLQAALIAGCAMLLVPLSSEAIGIKLRGSCSDLDFTGCGMELAVSPVPARVVMGVLTLIFLLLVTTLIRLRHWRTGVVSDPWSIVGIAMLTRHPSTRSFIETFPISARVKRKQLIEHCRGYLFRLGFGETQAASQAASGYGIIVDEKLVKGKSAGKPASRPSSRQQPRPLSHATFKQRLSRQLTSFLISLCWKPVAFLIFACSLMVLVLYYTETNYDTPFESFTDTPGFGVRFLFSGLGGIVTVFWSSLFNSMCLPDLIRPVAFVLLPLSPMIYSTT